MCNFIPKVRLQWANLVRHDHRFRPSEHSVAAEVANHANVRGNAWPSKRRLAEKLGLSERTVQRAIATLVKYGYLKRIVRLGRSNLCQLRFPGAGEVVDNPNEDRPLGGESESTPVSGLGHSCPPTGGTNGQETYPEPDSKTYAASPPSFNSLDQKKRKGPKGLGKKKKKNFPQKVYANGQTRTMLELELARRIGQDSVVVLFNFSPNLIEVLLLRLAAGEFDEDDLLKVREIVDHLQRKKGK